MEKLSERIARWIRGRVIRSGSGGVVLGLSGGIDSAVAAVLAKKAMGEEVLALLLPCHSLPEDEADALYLADLFHLRRERVDLAPVCDAFLKQLPPAGIACRANLKPRLRMAALYYFANKLNYLVMGTGNKSERLMGYFTKFGDGGADLLPLGDLTKARVRKLAKELQIPDRIIRRPPSAGLWKGQTDEEDMAIRYRDLDRIIESLEDSREPRISRGKVEYVKGKMAKSRHKRSLPPIFRLKLKRSLNSRDQKRKPIKG
ncbi:MAG: NAD+ synthase [Syntrophaceae bacterium]|nr:NAD+ synthase [Syntrophaceae bacterium]